MSGITALQRVLIAPESTAGTSPADNYETWRGQGQIKDNQVTNVITESVGIAVPAIRTYTPRTGSSLALESIPATFEQIYHIFNAGVGASLSVIDPPTTGSGYIREWSLGITVPNTLKTYSIITGDNQRLNRMAYSFVESFTLSGSSGDALMIDSNWQGRKTEKGVSLPATITTPDVEVILPCKNASVYIDDKDGDVNARTQVSNLVHEWSLSVTTGYTPIYYADDGRCDFGKVVFSRDAFSAELTLKFEHNNTANAEEDKWSDNEPRLYRLELFGSDLTTAGSEETKKRLTIDIAGVYTDVSALGDTDGNSTLDVTLQVGYEPVSGESFKLALVNEIA